MAANRFYSLLDANGASSRAKQSAVSRAGGETGEANQRTHNFSTFLTFHRESLSRRPAVFYAARRTAAAILQTAATGRRYSGVAEFAKIHSLEWTLIAKAQWLHFPRLFYGVEMGLRAVVSRVRAGSICFQTTCLSGATSR